LTEDKEKKIAVYHGKAKIGEVLGGLASIQLRPEDFSSPIALQMAFSRIYEGVMKAVESGPKKKYVAEVRFTDSLGNPVVIGIDLGETPPPFSKKEVNARILIELYEEE
jgi:hypothetical protein